MDRYYKEGKALLKVFLVEDEVVVREGIKNNINWSEHGFHFCGEASDGELAFPMIQQAKPDIVITDIRMPFMDGLELSSLIKKEFPGIKIIILSGYSEFEYAKKAINLGVTEYLLKPISGAELMKSMKVIRDNLIKEQEEKESLENFKKEMKEYEEDEKRRLFYDIINNAQPLASIIQRGRELNIDLSACIYNIVLFHMSTPNKGMSNSQSISVIQKKIDVYLEENNNIIRFNCFLEGYVFLIKGHSESDLEHMKRKFINLLKAECSQLDYFGGIGIPVKRLGELYLSFHEASRAFAYRYIWEVNDFIEASNIARNDIFPILDKSESETQLDRKKIEVFLKSGGQEEIQYFVEEYILSRYQDSKNSMIFKQYVVMDMYYIVNAFLKEVLGNNDFKIEEPFKEISQLNINYETMKHYIKKIFSQAIELRDEITSKNNNQMIHKAKEFIQNNFTKDDISLNLVAANVYTSPTHFSAVFSQKTGQTFIKYLTDLRMNKAKELLKCTDMKTSEISYSIGYKDPHYFSYLFKKTQNCTPTQYRYHN